MRGAIVTSSESFEPPRSGLDGQHPERILDRARLGVLERLLAWRLRAVPLFAFVSLVALGLDVRAWRAVLLGLGLTLLTTLSVVELRAIQRKPLSPARIRWNMYLSGLCQLCLVAGSGGIASPVAPATLLLAVVFNLVGSVDAARTFVLGAQVPAFWLFATIHAFALVEGFVPGSASAPGLVVPSMLSISALGPFVGAFAYTLFLVGGMALGRRIRALLDDAAEARLGEQARLLEVHQDAARTMSALSGEIAHELKNPLASIKGLAGLLRRDVEGAGRERLDVMRGEIDRMQATLEEFLNYSRPLVPLESTPRSLLPLVREVWRLHEGLALQRGVLLTDVRGDDVVVSFDPRKVRQVLVNVIQNAIEATPAGRSVSVSLATVRDAVHVDVDDEGEGIDPGLAGKLFEVGATTKPHGSGIGLAVARGLARQHGGELLLEPRPEGGCRARLRLPLRPTSPEVP